MLINTKRILRVVFVCAIVLTVFSGCEKKTEKQSDFAIEKDSFRDIPDITRDEIIAIETLRRQYGSFVYGINLTTEAFIGKDGQINGYAVMFCNLLSEMFGVQFVPKYYQWGDLLRGLESGEVDFTGELMATAENRVGYFMTSPTINRTIKFYRISNSIPIEEIMRTRLPRYAFLNGAVVADDIYANTNYNFETVLVDSHREAYRMLKSGEVDSFFGLDTAEGAFDEYGDVESEEFYPLIFRSSCLSTRKEELNTIINVLDKVMSERTLEYLTEMQKRGYQQYLENKIYELLTEEERLYIKNNPVIKIGADFSNYPISFFNLRSEKWEGIYFEALDEVGKLTGLRFEVGNKSDTPLLNVIDMVEKGEAKILPELFQISEYEGRFLWSEIPIVKDNFVFISRSDLRNIDVNDVFHYHIAIRRSTIYSEMFKRIFPAHQNFTEYETMEETWDALKRGDVDIIFASRRRLVIYTNYYELADFKLNLVLDHTFDSFFAYNKDSPHLKSIVDKTLRVININNMANQWIYKTYDYRNKMAAAQRPWLIGATILFFFVLVLVTILLVKSRSTGRQLESLVAQRTGALAFETSKLQAMIASIPDLMFCKDTEFNYTQCNNSFERFMGFNENEIVGKSNKDGDWYTPEEVERMHRTDSIVIKENRVLTFEENLHSTVTGKKGIFETVKAPIRQDDAVIGIITIKRDITRRKEMEQELALQTSLFKTMLSSLPDVVFCKDLEFKYTLCNNYMAQVFGKEVDDILGKDDVDGIGLPPETAALARDSDMKVMSNQERVMYEELIKCADGVTRLYEIVKSPLVLDDKVIGVMAIGRDITQRKETERNLAFETSKLRAMIDSIPDLMFCKDKNLRYTQCNSYFEQFLGFHEADIVGKTDKDGTWLLPEHVEKIYEVEKTVMDEDKIYIFEEKVRFPVTGKEGVFETVKAPIRQGDQVEGIVAIVRDITRRKEMEEEVMAASRAKTSFLANMSHELRTPLNVVIGLTDLILEDDMSDHVRMNLVKISNAGSTLLSIVNDILDFSKIESGKLVISPVEYYVSSMLNDLITLVVTRLGEKPIKFLLNITDELPNKLLGDDLRVKQIFTNLLTNAIKYTREGSIELSVRCVTEGDMVWMDVAVSDTGMGIPEEDIDSLFLDYYQVSANATRNIEGTGLGLPITKRLVEMMSGNIGVESVHGKGSTFRFRIKQGFVDNTVLGAEISEKLRTFCYSDDKRVVTRKLVRVNLSHSKVLVVDDMQTNLDVASGILRKYQMQVDTLSSGQAAIDRVREGSTVYDLIFMDHMMPGMDGIETVDRIRALGTEYAKKIPIIALTANAIQGTDKMFYEHDFQAFITKPIDVMEMDSVLRKWLYDGKHDGHGSDVIIEDEKEEMIIEIPGVDSKKGLSLYAGETDVYLPLLRSYIANTPGILDKLRNVTAENLASYVITVHGLKGSSAGIGAEGVREEALELENLSRAGDLQSVLAKNDKLIKDAEIIVANVKEWLDKNDIHEAKPRQKTPDKELLAKLRESFENYDMKEIDKTMLELEKFDYDEDAELITWLRERIETSEFDEAVERLAEY